MGLRTWALFDSLLSSRELWSLRAGKSQWGGGVSRILFNVHKIMQPNKGRQGSSHPHSACDTSPPLLTPYPSSSPLLIFLPSFLPFSLLPFFPPFLPSYHQMTINLMRKSLQEWECYSLCGIMAQASLDSNCHIKQKILPMIFKTKRPTNYLENGLWYNSYQMPDCFII